MLQENQLFADRYKFIRQLGRGGFAEVWLAEDTKTGVEVAVKVYAPGTGLDETGIKIFTQEFSLVFDMNHTNLLRPTYFDSWERMPYLIMPLCKNGSAFKYITGKERITEEQCWNLLHDVAAGLAYLHEKEPPLIHQDIKPDNILINDEGHYMITDFGISARVRSTIRGAQAQEQSGGTLAYMGPERFSATPKPIMASDVWSLGAMMYELMTGGNPPFGNHGGVLQKNGADIPIIEEDFSQELKDIVYSCLAKETWDRPSARKIEELTYNKLHGIVMPAENDPQADIEPQQDSKPHPVSPQTQPKPTPQPKPKVQSNSKPGKTKVLIASAAAAVVLIGILIALFSNGGNNEELPQPVTAATVAVVNHDSIAEARIKEGMDLIYEADTFMANHQYDAYEEQYDKIEEKYMSALDKFEDALTNNDSLSQDVSSRAKEQRDTTRNRLYRIYNDLLGDYKDLKEAQSQDTAAYINRLEVIQPKIADLIKDSTKDNTTINEESSNEQNP